MAKKNKDKKAKSPSKNTNHKSNKPKKDRHGQKKKSTRRKGKSGNSSKGNPQDFGFLLYVRIRKLLWRRYKGDYRSSDYNTKGSEFLYVVREVYKECSATSTHCTDERFYELYEEIVSESRPKPYIALSLINEIHPYYEIKDVEFPIFLPYLWVKSPMIIDAPSDFRSGDYQKQDGDVYESYAKYFKSWVDYCNEYHRNDHGQEFGSDEIEIFFVFTEVEYSKEKRRWETEILVVDISGTIYNFGYIPKGTSGTPSEDWQQSQSEEEKKEEKGKAEKERKEPKKEHEEPESKTDEKKALLERLLLAKKSQLDEIRMWHELGEKDELEKAVRKLKEINKKIDELL